ncbi:MAG: hypothetical protein WCO06_07200 [Candidatus Roizmanbacteria bacterium]
MDKFLTTEPIWDLTSNSITEVRENLLTAISYLEVTHMPSTELPIIDLKSTLYRGYRFDEDFSKKLIHTYSQQLQSLR